MERKFGEGVKFERIRRITGYLVGSVDRFNNAKAAEVRDRVKHCSMNRPRDEPPCPEEPDRGGGGSNAPTGPAYQRRTTAPHEE